MSAMASPLRVGSLLDLKSRYPQANERQTSVWIQVVLFEKWWPVLFLDTLREVLVFQAWPQKLEKMDAASLRGQLVEPFPILVSGLASPYVRRVSASDSSVAVGTLTNRQHWGERRTVNNRSSENSDKVKPETATWTPNVEDTLAYSCSFVATPIVAIKNWLDSLKNYRRDLHNTHASDKLHSTELKHRLSSYFSRKTRVRVVPEGAQQCQGSFDDILGQELSSSCSCKDLHKTWTAHHRPAGIDSKALWCANSLPEMPKYLLNVDIMPTLLEVGAMLTTETAYRHWRTLEKEIAQGWFGNFGVVNMEYDAKHLKREQHNTRKERSGGLLCAVFHRVHDRGTKQCGERDEQQ